MPRIVIALPIALVLIFFLIAFLKYATRKPEQGQQKTKVKKRVKKGAPTDEYEQGRLSAQDVLGLADIIGPDIIMTSGDIINIFKIGCVNVSLLTTPERVEEAKRSARVLSTLRQGFTILKLHRPADNTQQIKLLRQRLEEVERELTRVQHDAKRTKVKEHERQFLLTRHRVLTAKYNAELDYERKNGKRYITETFICVKTPAKKNSQKHAEETARQLLTRLSANGYPAKRLVDLELVDICKAYFDEPVSPKININPKEQMPVLESSLRDLVLPAVEVPLFDEEQHQLLHEAEASAHSGHETTLTTDDAIEAELAGILREIEIMDTHKRKAEHVA